MVKNIYILSFLENNKIAEGENSIEFYFDTLITSPPSNLKCESDTANSLKITWEDPAQGMEGLESYSFSYDLSKILILYLGFHCIHIVYIITICSSPLLCATSRIYRRNYF